MANSLWRRRVRSAGVVIGALMLLAACSGGASGGESAAEPSDRSGAGGRASTFAEQGSAENVGATAVLVDRKLVKTAALGLASRDVDRVLGELEDVVTTYQGIVESRNVRTDDDGEAASATVVLRVPVDRFETAVEDITGLARLVREHTSTQDVTARVADVEARVDSAERSIAQLQRLFSRATEVGDVIALESELSQRQAELESLQARQRALGRQTALSTIHVSITKAGPGQGSGDDRQPGFVDGLVSGWSALVTFLRGAAHVLGLLLPLGALAVLVAVPVWLVLRRRLLTRSGTDG